ncbi:M20/M25/M40 family metallo-hydrolase [bacterium]|nr:M20/M25/M40 family metallo-hydrolase [bacterium]
MIEMLNLLSELVNRWDEKAELLDILYEKLKEKGIETHIEGESAPLLISHQGNGEPSLCLYCHIDTSPPYALSQPIYREENGKAYGLGICDKASVVAILDVFLEMKDKIEKGSLDLIITSDSEEQGEELKRIFEKGYSPRWVIIGEPTNLSIVTQHPGILLLDIYCYGLSAPTAFPFSGINSIWEMVDFLNELKERLPFVLLGIKGGESILRVPERCYSTLAIPLPSDKDATWALRILDGVLKQPRWMDVSYHIRRIENPLKQEIFSPLAQVAREMVRKVLGRERETAQPGWSEASRFQERGAEVIVFGAGEPSIAHSGEEFVIVEDIMLQSRILKGIISSLLTSSSSPSI